MTKNSMDAFASTEQMRLKHKQRVLIALKNNPKSSRFSIGRITGLGDIEAQRRISELMNEKLVEITGSRLHLGNYISLFSVKEQLELFPKVKKPGLKRWLKTEHPEILDLYESI